MNNIDSPNGKKILIVNLHSALNLGDDAIMQETLRGVHEVFPHANITLAATDPESWSKYKNVDIVGSLTSWAIFLQDRKWYFRFGRFPIDAVRLLLAIVFYRLGKWKLLFGSNEQRRLLSAYYEADLILSCGGGYFYAYRRLSPFYLMALATIWLAACLHKRIIMLPQSIGPIKGKLQFSLATRIFNKVDLIMVREMLSKKYLDEKFRISSPIVFVPDLAFGLPIVEAKIPLTGNNVESQKKIGVSIIDRGAQTRSFGNQQEYEESLINLIEKLLDAQANISIYLFSQCFGPGIDHDDRIIVERIYSRLKNHQERVFLLGDFKDALEIKAAYKCMDLVIGTRMHTGILAISEFIPAIMIGYQPKTFGVMQVLGLEQYCMDIESINITVLFAVVEKIIEDSRNFILKLHDPLDKTQKQIKEWPNYLKV